MVEISKEQEDAWKKVSKIEATVDTKICSTPAFICALGIASNGNGEADGIVYDGQDASGRFHIHLYCVDEATDWIIFSTPMYFRQGIYVDVGTNVEQIVVQYLPVKE